MSDFLCQSGDDSVVQWLMYSLELQQEQPQLYDNLTKILNPDEQQIVQSVVVQADANAVAAQAVAAAPAPASQHMNGGAH